MPSSKRPTQAQRRAATRAKLLASAARTIARRGYQAASLDSVAESAGLSKGALTYHFASKERLLLALAADRIGQRREQVRTTTGLDPSHPDAAARELIERLPYEREWALLFLEFVCQGARDRRFGRGLADQLEPGRADAAAAVQATGLASGTDARTLADGLSALSNGISTEALLDGDEERARALFVRMLSLVFRGLRAEAAERAG